MNILPMVTAFALLFALCSYTLLHQSIAVQFESIKVRGAHRIERVLLTELDRISYHRHPVKTSNKKKDKPKDKEITEMKYHSPRMVFNKKPLTKLNLAPLLTVEESPDQKLLQIAAMTLIKNLYQYTSVYEEEMEKELFTLLLKTLKEHPEIESLQQAYAHLEERRELFYKLFRGTQNYQLSSNVGLPPLTDFFILEKKRASMQFAHASRPVLEAILGLPLTATILQEEEARWHEDHKEHPFTKVELSDLLLKERKNPTDYEPLLNFSTSHTKSDQFIFQDKLSRVQKKLPRE
ncbi:MAG: hypothetical protein K940chlam2_00239 [Chlamydiae bacterium]|nr:hypothetical protein [Chlamydiota bacterium]